jgi:PAS domain S-box-containing protein
MDLVEHNRTSVRLVASRTQLRILLDQNNQQPEQELVDQMEGILRDAHTSCSHILNILVLANDGRVVARAAERGFDDGLRDRLYSATEEGGLGLRMARGVDGNLILALSSPLYLQERRVGAVILEAEGAQVVDVVADYTGLGDTGETILARRDEQGVITFLAPLRFQPDAALNKNASRTDLGLPIVQALLGKEYVLTAAVDYRGQEVLAATAWVEDPGWGLAVSIARVEALWAADHMRDLLALALVVLVLVVTLVSLVLSRHITKPVLDLTRVARRIGAGDLSVHADALRKDELGVLADTFNHMTKALLDATARLEETVQQRTRSLEKEIRGRERAEKNLREANVFLDSIVENIPYMIFVKSGDDLRFVRFNRAGEELLGYRREEMIGKNDYDFFPKEEADFFTEKDRKVLSGGERIDIAEEPVDTRHHGTRYLYTKKIPIYDEEGKPLYMLGISEDITERKEREAQARKYVAEVEKLNRDMAVLLGDLRAANEKLQGTTTRLQEANEDLESFTYSVSHDLRAPLRAVNGFAEALLKDYAEDLDETGRHFLEEVAANARFMGRLIDDLLDFSRAGRKELDRMATDMAGIVTELTRELHAAHPDRQLRFEVGELPPASGDEPLLRQVWYNLLANAVKFTRPCPEAVVEVGSEQEGDDVVYFVRDNGVGFDMQYVEQVFGVFQRLHKADEYEGTGVGLAIVQRIVARHGGRLWAEAKPGEGATFRFTIPEGKEGTHD